MVRAKLSTRKPGNIRLYQHSIRIVAKSSKISAFSAPANKLLVPEHTLALILFHVLLVRVPDRNTEFKTDDTGVHFTNGELQAWEHWSGDPLHLQGLVPGRARALAALNRNGH